MNTSYPNQIEHIPLIKNLYYNQPFNTFQRGNNELRNKSSTTSPAKDTQNQLEPITLSIYNGKNQETDTTYVMKTTLSYISFRVTNPNYISVTLDPLTIFLKTYRRKKRTGTKKLRQKYFVLKGLEILHQSEAYFYFRPSSNYKNIFIEGPVQFRTNIYLRLTETAMCQPVYIRRNTQVGTLQPVLSPRNQQYTPAALVNQSHKATNMNFN